MPRLVAQVSRRAAPASVEQVKPRLAEDGLTRRVGCGFAAYDCCIDGGLNYSDSSGFSWLRGEASLA